MEINFSGDKGLLAGELKICGYITHRVWLHADYSGESKGREVYLLIDRELVGRRGFAAKYGITNKIMLD